MTGDEAEGATLAAVDSAVLAELPFLRIIHGMGTGVVRERVRRVLQRDRRVAKFDFAPRQAGRHRRHHRGVLAVSLIPDEIIEQVKDATDIVAGGRSRWTSSAPAATVAGCCPFHGGTHRNFAVIPRKGLFYCYVCHEAGDVFSYMIKRFGMDYPTAVRELARKAGIVVPEKQQRAGPDPNEPLYGAVAVRAGVVRAPRCSSRPTRATPAPTWRSARSRSRRGAARAGLRAPGRCAFMDAMRGLGIKDQVLVESGLAVQRDDGRIDARFRDAAALPDPRSFAGVPWDSAAGCSDRASRST